MSAKSGDSGSDRQQRIEAYLTSRIPGADGLHMVNIERPTVGWSHEIWLFDAVWTESGKEASRPFCVRIDPGNTLLRHMSSLETQFRVLKCLENTAVPTPEAYWYESDLDIIGKPFIVMDRVPGACPNPWGSDGRRYYQEASERGVLPGSFTQALADLHNLDWRAAGLDFLGVPGPGNDFALSEVAKWKELMSLAGVVHEPILEDLICWLEENAPTTDRLSLIHGAYRTGNLLIHDDRVSAVLDWETQCIGDPMYDVAYMLSDLNREGTDLLSNLVPRDEFFRQYERETGLEIDEEKCRYYNMLYCMRSVAFWVSASGLYADGSSSDLRLARTAWSIPVVLDRAARELGY